MATIFDIKHFAVHDGPGIRTTVFFKGCPLKCIWCHNPESISPKPQLAFSNEKCKECRKCERVCKNSGHIFNDMHTVITDNCIFCGECEKNCPSGALTLYGREVTVSEILPEILEDKDFYEGSGGGVTLSGGECLMQGDFCASFLKELKKYGIHTAVDTCGMVSKSTLDKVIPYTDLFLYDVKAIDENVHINCTGQSNKIILKNLKYLDSKNKKIEIRIPFIPDYNDGQIEKIANLLSKLKNITKVKVLPYHNMAASKYNSLNLTNTLPARLPKDTEVEAARETLRKKLNVTVI